MHRTSFKLDDPAVLRVAEAVHRGSGTHAKRTDASLFPRSDDLRRELVTSELRFADGGEFHIIFITGCRFRTEHRRTGARRYRKRIGIGMVSVQMGEKGDGRTAWT